MEGVPCSKAPAHKFLEAGCRSELIVDLPDVNSINDVTLDVGDASIVLKIQDVSTTIPLPVKLVGRSTESAAKFSRRRHQLTLTWQDATVIDETSVAAIGFGDTSVPLGAKQDILRSGGRGHQDTNATACRADVESGLDKKDADGLQSLYSARWEEEASSGCVQNYLNDERMQNQAQAEEVKVAANIAFSQCDFRTAVALYGDAIDLYPDDHTYYANRALGHIKLENFGSAIMDATKAVELDSTFMKGYYRRGIAYFALGKLRESKLDLDAVLKLDPDNREAQSKLAEVEKALKNTQSQSTVATKVAPKRHDGLADNAALQPCNVSVEDGYSGPRMGDDNIVTDRFIDEMLQHFKDEHILHRRYTLAILWQAHAILQAEDAVVDVPVPRGSHITVCGDVHGQFYDLLNIFKLNGMPSEDNPYLFNGDFVDRGSFSLETILTLLAFKVRFPNSFHLNRGNHESVEMNTMYGFEGEVKEKCGGNLMLLFVDLFQWLPLAHVIGGKVLVVHGGLFSRDSTTLEDVRNISRHREPPDEGPMHELLWSDPQPQPGRSPSKRGVGVGFGPDVTKRFLERNNLSLLIRSHECKDDGYEVQHDGKTITVFSAPNYCDQIGNRGAFIRLEHDLKPKFTSFDAVPHPPVRPMKYAGIGGFNIFNFLR